MWPLGSNDAFAGDEDGGDVPPPLPPRSLTIQRSHRLVSLAVRRVTLAGAMSGGAWRVWIFLEGWLGGLVPTMFTWRMRKLGWGEGDKQDGEGRAPGSKPIPVDLGGPPPSCPITCSR